MRYAVSRPERGRCYTWDVRHQMALRTFASQDAATDTGWESWRRLDPDLAAAGAHAGRSPYVRQHRHKGRTARGGYVPLTSGSGDA